MTKIKVKLTETQTSRLESTGQSGGSLEHVQQVVQSFFDQQPADIWDGRAVFLPFQAQYTNVDKRARILYVLVNDSERTINGVTGSLLLKLPIENAQAASSQIDFPQEFIGEIHPQEAVLFFIDTPVKGLYEDQVFHMPDLNLYIKDIAFQVAEEK